MFFPRFGGRRFPPRIGACGHTEPTHSGKYCHGKTPLQTFIESATLTYDKQLDRIKPTSEPVTAAA
jgi:hypothetical protein